MPRLSTLIAVLIAIASAFALYRLKHDTALLEASLRSAERRVDSLKSEIAVLRAEHAYYARPERIESLARAQGLRPATEAQLRAALGDVAAPALSR